ncbi:MAG: hypothetical protein ACE5I7_02450 [Candidatus Binatia bacterium]
MGKLAVGVVLLAGTAVLPVALRAAVQPACVGNCNGDAEVTIDELVTLVNVALGTFLLSSCPAGDQNGDGQVTVDEVLTAVNNALLGCRGRTPSPTRPTPPSPTSSSTATRTSTQTGTPMPTRTRTATTTTTPTPTPAMVTIDGLCERGLERCPLGTMVRVLRCKNRNRAGCLTTEADLLGVAEVSGPNGEFSVSLESVEVGAATLVFEAEVDPATTYRLIDFGQVGPGGGGGGVGVNGPIRIGPDSEAAVRLLDEAGLETFDENAIENVIQTVGGETAALPPALLGLNIETPIEVAAAYTGQAEASVAVRTLLRLPTAAYLAVRFTTMGGCVETGQNQRIVHGGFQPFSFIFTDSLEGRVAGQALTQVDEFFVIGQRRNDGSLRVFARSNGFARTRTGPFRDQLSVGSFNGTGTLNLEIQIHIKRTDVGPVPAPSGATCVSGGATQTCVKCTVPLLLVR